MAKTQVDTRTDDQEIMSIEQVAELSRRVRENVSKVIVGKDDVVEMLLVAIMCEGHILVEDVPGVGKTMMARSVAASLNCSFNRIQCTPDLLPSDITGVSIFNQKTNEFEFRPGPVITQILLADEVNRATPRAQSSLLECMEERQVTVDGKTRRLPRPFLVIATQNPIEYEGTFPLPEAQLDRFLIKLSVGYPNMEEESEILIRLQYSHPIESVERVLTVDQLLQMQQAVKHVYVEDSVREYIVRLVQATRDHQDISLGASPRASLALFKTGQALAALRGRDYVLPDDIKYMFVPVLSHRLILKPESELRGRTPASVLEHLLETVPLELEPEEYEENVIIEDEEA